MLTSDQLEKVLTKNPNFEIAARCSRCVCKRTFESASDATTAGIDSRDRVRAPNIYGLIKNAFRRSCRGGASTSREHPQRDRYTDRCCEKTQNGSAGHFCIVLNCYPVFVKFCFLGGLGEPQATPVASFWPLCLTHYEPAPGGPLTPRFKVNAGLLALTR